MISITNHSSTCQMKMFTAILLVLLSIISFTVHGQGISNTVVEGGKAADDKDNIASGSASFIGGGEGNTASAPWSVVCGGLDNTASGTHGSTIVGGLDNTASGSYSLIGSGVSNKASAYTSTVSGGQRNEASEYGSTIGGGLDNEASGRFSFVGGGRDNTASGDYSIAMGYKAKAVKELSFVINLRKKNETKSTRTGQFLVRSRSFSIHIGNTKATIDRNNIKTFKNLLEGTGRRLEQIDEQQSIIEELRKQNNKQQEHNVKQQEQNDKQQEQIDELHRIIASVVVQQQEKD